MYAQISDLQLRLGVVFDRIYAYEHEAATDLAAASAEIDGCLAKRYAVPVTGAGTAALLLDWSLTLAEERAYARGGAGKLSENVANRVAQTRKYLEMILNGMFLLAGAEENSASTAGITLTESNESEFTRTKLEEY